MKINYKVLIVDDHPIVAQGIRQVVSSLDSVECTEVSDGGLLKSWLESGKASFDLCVMDLEMPNVNGLELIRLLHRQMPCCRILIYTMHDEVWYVARLVQEGISTYVSGAVSKSVHIDELRQAIQKIREGGEYFSDAFLTLTGQKSGSDIGFPKLSNRENEVIVLLSKGLSTTEIADRLFLSVNTIQTYRRRLLDKYEARNVAELISKWKENHG